MSGVFIAFEGCDGSGKTTQVERVAAALRQQGRPVVVTREPGGTIAGRALQRLTEGVAASTRVETLAFALDRAIHVEQVIHPALFAGDVVITDRFVDSSIAYQGFGAPANGPEPVAAVNTYATGGLTPDLTVLLDIDPVVGLNRIGRTRTTISVIEQRSLDFHRRVRAGYLDLARARTGARNYLVVDATQPAETVTDLVLAAVDTLFPHHPTQQEDVS